MCRGRTGLWRLMKYRTWSVTQQRAEEPCEAVWKRHDANRGRLLQQNEGLWGKVWSTHYVLAIETPKQSNVGDGSKNTKNDVDKAPK